MDDNELYEAVPVPAPGTMMRREAFGVMLAGGNMPILNLNEDAAAVWELFDGKRTVREIEALLLEEYEDDAVRQMLPEFVRFCLHAGVVTVAR